jgi:hypothetical protein
MATQARFGRRFAPDARDKQFQIPRAVVPATVTQRTWFTRDVFDQGNSSMCVAYSGVGWLLAGPVRNVQEPPGFAELYMDCQRNDEWPGEEPMYEGTSVRALMRVLKRRGYISEYRWAWNLEPVVNHILAVSPVVLGTTWYSSMMETDADGFLKARGELVGGHAYLAIGANRTRSCPDGTKGAIRIVNSWGRAWGQSGRAWISFADLSKLLSEDGEAATATEVRREPVPDPAAVA